jgi:hypothetical protein
MIDGIFIIIICFIMFILFQMIKLTEEIRLIINLIIVSSLLFYIASDVTDLLVSKMFIILGIVSLFLIPFSIVMKYIEKL